MRKFLVAFAVCVAGSSIALAALSGSTNKAALSSGSPCECCSDCRCENCICAALGCACDSGGDCVCDAACCETGSCCEAGSRCETGASCESGCCVVR